MQTMITSSRIVFLIPVESAASTALSDSFGILLTTTKSKVMTKGILH